MTLQVYCALIASVLLVLLWTGRKPTQRQWEALQLYRMGWASLADLERLFARKKSRELPAKGACDLTGSRGGTLPDIRPPTPASATLPSCRPQTGSARPLALLMHPPCRTLLASTGKSAFGFRYLLHVEVKTGGASVISTRKQVALIDVFQRQIPLIFADVARPSRELLR